MSDTPRTTPGPWTVELDVVNNGDIHIFAPESRPLALIDVREYPEDTDGIPRETALANARLMARAPDLEAENARLSSQHSPDCDAVTTSPLLGPSEKPCNCHAWQIAELQQDNEELIRQLAEHDGAWAEANKDNDRHIARIEALEKALAVIIEAARKQSGSREFWEAIGHSDRLLAIPQAGGGAVSPE